ncbi:MATE family efflux transporter [Marinicella sediminis]|uniref:Multidrug-efflux transporter n=1 Tax=Marinicella sediminis TaxID=1792834 RepID=A0ABV7JAC7_9GAMM|nr:MATE family efflux transporter [Marinicella sediminis]
MTTKNKIGSVLKLAVPIAIGLASGYLMVFVDLFMVGKLGNDALAALGIAGFTHAMMLSLVAGVTPAVQGIVARWMGEGNSQPKCLPLNGGLLIALIIGIPLSIICHYFTPAYFAFVSSDPVVVAEGSAYLRALILATLAIGFMRAFIGFWAGMSRAKVIMVIEILMNVVNAVLNYMLIFGHWGAPAMGTEGAGIASAIAYVFATTLFFIMTFLMMKAEGFLTILPGKKLLIALFNRGIPAIFQELFFAAGFVVLFMIISMIGSEEVAAATVLTRITIIMLLFAMALGMASSTLVSNALGKGEVDLANHWGWLTGVIGIFTITLFGLPMLIFPETVLSIFMPAGKALEIAVVPLQLIAMTNGVVSLVYIFSITLFSIGHGTAVLLVSFVLQWLIFIPAAWFVGPHLKMGLLGVWVAYTVYTLLATLFISMIWRIGKWKTAHAV